MRIAITGPDGFLAWHTRCALRARQDADAIGIGRAEFNDPLLMDVALAEADAVIHLAGINRGSDSDVATVNPWLAEQLVAGLERSGRVIPVVYGNSIQSEGDSVFGAAKRQAAVILAQWGERVGAPIIDVVLPNIFGEHGKPFYNSVVATFCHQLAAGLTPQIDVDRELPLLHAQDAAAILLAAAMKSGLSQITPSGTWLSVSSLLARIESIQSAYVEGHLPNLADPLTRDLFNTYRSFTFPDQWPIHPQKHSDDRGVLVEAVRASGGEAQVFYSSTRPGFTRGGHFHLRKTERFLVVQGQASIRLRKLFSDEVVEFLVSGEQPAIVDMPTLWTHSITNTGETDLLTLFYADDEYDPQDPDTYWVAV
jgi:UDP-2-acetamido-2,6-beta-L-arabino-hexul-4-ose reductase